jgi:hypothetical protein
MRGSLADATKSSVSLTAALRTPRAGKGCDPVFQAGKWAPGEPWSRHLAMEPMVGIIHLHIVAPRAFLPSEAAMRQVFGKPDVPRGPERRSRRSIATMSACSVTSQNGRPPAARPSRPADVRRPRARPER